MTARGWARVGASGLDDSRPSMMTLLAKAGFSQSYTYFTWKNTKAELVELVEQLREWSPFLRPNLWPNTPDILHEYLQQGGRPAFECRLDRRQVDLGLT